MSKSVRFLLVDTPFAGVHGTTSRGACVPPSGSTTACRFSGTATSDFVLPGTTNPFPSFQRPLCGVGGRQPPAPPGGEFKDVSPLTDKTVGERTLEALSPLPPASFCGILWPHTSSTLHPKRPDETYPLQAPAGDCLPAVRASFLCRREGRCPG